MNLGIEPDLGAYPHFVVDINSRSRIVTQLHCRQPGLHTALGKFCNNLF